jgi:aspartyl-tRNA(Asn)/glutamyl-tRNA(Gln) amidotransferase subunit A
LTVTPISAGIPDWAELGADARRKLSSTATMRARRLERLLNAFVTIEDRIPVFEGALGGMPYAVKDIFRTASHLPTGGLSNPSDLGIAGKTNLLNKLDHAGGHCIGYTAMTELAYEPSGYNRARGSVRNPWNLDFIPGGSSSGSAAAVASGSAVVAFGSDTGGSLRIPAHCCGITAWKPSMGAISMQGAMPLAPSLDTIGLLARSASDMRLAADILIEDDHGRMLSKIARAVAIDDCFYAADEPVRRACLEGLGAIEAHGVNIERRNALDAIKQVDIHAMTILQGEAARVHRARIDDPALDPILRQRLEKGLAIDEMTLAASYQTRSSLIDDFIANVFGDSDVIILPVMAIRVPLATETDPDSNKFSPRTLYALSRFTRFVNMLGFPAVAVPSGFDDRGLPVALQIVGRPDTDCALLSLVDNVQKTTRWHAHIPAAVADSLPGLMELVT